MRWLPGAVEPRKKPRPFAWQRAIVLYQIRKSPHNVLHRLGFEFDPDRVTVAQPVPVLEPVLSLVQVELGDNLFAQAVLGG